MELSQISKSLWYFLQGRKTFFITWNPNVVDFRSNRESILKIYSLGEALEIPIPKEYLHSFVGILSQSIFAQGKLIIGWDLKQLFSYLKFNLPNHWQIPAYCEFIDLKLGESFLGVAGDCPSSFEEASYRTGLLIDNSQFVKISQRIFIPLSIEVLPGIETVGIANRTAGQRLYSSYHIEGQANGRLGCKQDFDGCFLPHTLTKEEKSKFSPGHEKKFLVFDFKSMEVCVLQWLSKDKVLGEIIKSGEDVYSTIYQIVVEKNKCSEDKRQWIKGLFLPIVYGQSANKIMEKLGYSINGANYLIETIKSKFSGAFEWIQGQQDQLKQNDVVIDCFGRVLDFSEDMGRKSWSIRNAVVQGPAAMICLEKLIQLYQQKFPSLELVASVHDGYVCTVDSNLWNQAAVHSKEILETPSTIAQDCVLRAAISVGDDWGDLNNTSL